MTLPKIDYPLNEIELPSLKRKVHYRPMLVKEEKLLLIAKQSESGADIFTAIKQVVNNCVVDKKFDVDRLPLHELELFFLTIRIRSIGDKVTLTFHDNEDGEDYNFEVPLEEIRLKGLDDVLPNKIDVTEDIGIVMRFPPATLYDNPNFLNGTNLDDISQEMLLESIESIWEGDTVHDVIDDGITRDDLLEFLESLDMHTYREMQRFLGSVPHMEHVITYTNTKGTERGITLKTLNDFFIL